METNESILVRDVVGLDDRRVIGKMRELRVDCDSLAVSHYVVASATTTSPLVLPFDRALSVGDTFVTVQTRENFLPASSAEAQALIAGGFKLVGVDAYSRTGNKLGTVASYEFDPVYGTVTSLKLADGSVYPADTFVFFAPEFVFVDNGAKTAAELRATGTTAAAEIVADEVAEEAVAEVELEEAVAEVALEEAAEEEAAEEVEEAAEEAVEEAEEELEAPELSDEDAQLVELLVGASLVDDVTSEDGAFTAEKGTVLTRAMVYDAISHDALLLLTLGADI
ncbi:hypothetical protein VJ918_07800 [Adlercreutzia sp. R21]|uniref:PRC-barrel domain-containing protein n=1 Tax=Adlercreutzia wanghongyangiae TaxID=3111451 RepID=A0ABU6IK67_9ACTN|nr:hypothetical protein [Adlercreutzia sp. R21]MEC4176785.1 hypothetical protein [Adlercreutzia sp. R7]MEC4184709.1 hypothetical protein [Adlercreutzia sp. R21]